MNIAIILVINIVNKCMLSGLCFSVCTCVFISWNERCHLQYWHVFLCLYGNVTYILQTRMAEEYHKEISKSYPIIFTNYVCTTEQH